MELWDYIVVGAGSAGCALAGRLTAAGRRVLLVEAGPPDRSIWVKLPIGYGRTFHDARVNWRFHTLPIPGMGGRTNYVPRGKVVGGSSAINAMVYSRGQPADFDAWEAAGNPGWGWAEVLDAYRRIEDHDLGAGPLHGAGGPLHVSVTDAAAHPLTRAWIAACGEIGIPPSADLNGATIEGAGCYQITTRAGWRESAATAFLRPAGGLRLLTGHRVSRLLFEGRQVVGIVTQGPAGQAAFRAGAEVVLAAGAIGTPTILQLSGVGPGAVLQRLGLPVVLDSPAVGRHLSDHLCHDHTLRTRVPSLNQELRPFLGKARAALRFALRRTGPLAMSLNQGGGFTRTAPDRPVPDLQLYFSPLTYDRAPKGRRPLMSPDPFPGVILSVSPCKPASRGWVEPSAPDWRAPPAIQPNFLDHPGDVADLVAGARLLRRIAASPALARLVEAELHPGPATRTEAEIEADVRARAYSVYHPCGTCRMGPDPATAAVDARLRAHGLGGLRVADASVFPEITSGNTNAPAMMVGWRAADLILAGA